MEGRFIAVVIIVTVGKMIMSDLLDGMNEVVAVVVIIIMMMMATADHIIVETKDAGIIMMMIEILIEEIMAEGEEAVATVDAAVQGEAEVDPCQGAVVDHILAHVM